MANVRGPRKIRRLVTGHDENGKAIIIYDGPAENIRTDENRPGFGVTELWVANETPTSNEGDEDTSLRPFTLPPPDGGSVFRILEIPPEAEIKGSGTPSTIENAAVESKRHPGMHKTRTIDYVVVISGRIDLLLDDSEARLEAGDTMVQRGTVHAWSNPGPEPCVVMFVLIDAKPL